MREWTTALLLSAMVLSGCIGEDSRESEDIAMWDEGLTQLSLEGLDDIRNFSVAYAFDNDSIGESHWAVFGNEEGGNCCEHYLAMTKEGWILNFGGEYPTWSEDRGRTWQEYVPSVFSQIGCLEPKPTVPGQEGLGEGSIVQATNGDLIAMGWFPYPSTSGADQFYAFFYDADDEEWSWCFN
ncbi:MAG TPA: hypothetical protein HA247_03450, partial [Candidatus Thalassarchaeaceae archaeon]